jgi:hypothetical protein
MSLPIFSMQPTSWIKFFKNYIRYLIKNHSVAVLPQIFKLKNFDINVDLHWAKLDDSDSMTREDYIGDKFLINWITVGKVPPKHVSTSMLTLISMWSTRSERDEIVYLEIKTCLYIGWHACNNSGPFFMYLVGSSDACEIMKVVMQLLRTFMVGDKVWLRGVRHSGGAFMKFKQPSRCRRWSFFWVFFQIKIN